MMSGYRCSVYKTVMPACISVSQGGVAYFVTKCDGVRNNSKTWRWYASVVILFNCNFVLTVLITPLKLMYLPVNWGHLYTRIVSAFEMIFLHRRGVYHNSWSKTSVSDYKSVLKNSMEYFATKRFTGIGSFFKMSRWDACFNRMGI